MSKIQNDYSAKPLMYIIQPEQEGISAKMQTLVIKKPKKQRVEQELDIVETELETTDETHLEVESTETVVETSSVIENTETVIETPAVTETAETEAEKIKDIEEKPKKKRRERKPISEMSIPEKVKFFAALPKTMPKSLCLIETEEVKYRGLIMGEDNGIVIIRSLQHPDAVNIPIDEIKAISILGF